ncbi:MAG: RNA polymerase sigma factor [Ruminococcaceae bacterium]|nr:RNA polymerase sigma factor [Oscillospiraceae bacterium]
MTSEVDTLAAVSYWDDNEINRIYEKYVDTIYRVCYMLLKSEHEAEDVCQNVFIKLINSDKQFESDEHIKAWLILCAKNESKNLLKHWWRSKKVSVESIAEISVEDKYNDDETLKLVLSLPDRFKIPVYLYYYEGYSTDEIATILKINPSTVRGQLKTGREKLKVMLKDGENNV